MSIQIRKAKLHNADALATLLKSLGWFAHLSSEPDEMTGRRVAHHLSLCMADESHSVYVATWLSDDMSEENATETHPEMVGYAAVHWLPYLFLSGPEGYISELFVHESKRGQGIGTRLLDAVRAEAQGRGCSRLLLLNNRNRESYQRKFYERQGWKEREDMANFVYPLN